MAILKKIKKLVSRKTKPKKKPAKKKIAKTKTIRPRTAPKPAKPIGRVTHFYGGIKVAVVKFSADIKKGTPVRFEGATTKFSQKLDSMQYEHASLAKAPKGKKIGVKVKSRVREGDKVYTEGNK